MNLETKVRIIPYMKADAGVNMAIDQSLLNSMESQIANGEKPDPVLRVYSFSSPTVIFGYHQKIDGRLNEELAEQMGVKYATRESGGGHMYFSPNDVHFCFISPEGRLTDNSELIKRYQKTNSKVVEALKELGYDSSLGRTSIRLGDERIVAGTAIRQKGNSYMHQGGILVDNYNDEIFSLLMARSDEIEKWKSKVTSLKENSENYISLPGKIISKYNGYIKPLTKEELEYVESLNHNFYSNQEFLHSGEKEADICLIAEYTKDKDNLVNPVGVQYA